MPQGDQQEVVMLFSSEGEVCKEMRFKTFEALIARKSKLEGYAASIIKAAYAVIGNGLSLRGVVFFTFTVDEDGLVDASFNLPLRYLAQHAGIGEDLGQGPVRKASRGQCPVPWHAVNLWEPEVDKGLQLVQSRVFRNRLRLKNTSSCRDEDFFPPQEEILELFDDQAEAPVEYHLDGNDLRAHMAPEPKRAEPADKNQEFAAKLTEVFGEAGKLSLQDLIRLHADQLDQAKAKHRTDIEQQQLGYLDQLRTCREEIHALKVALRQEQGRNRRLQQMLRGDI